VERVSIDLAAQRLGVSVSTVRRRIRDGTLEVEREQTAQGFKYHILLPDTNGEVPETEVSAAPAPDLSAKLADVEQERDWLRARVEELTTMLNREQETSLRLSLALSQRPAIGSPVDTPTPTQRDHVPEPSPPMAAEQPQAPATHPARRGWLRRLLGL